MTTSTHEHDSAADRWQENRLGQFPDPSGEVLSVRVVEAPQEVNRRATGMITGVVLIPAQDTTLYKILPAQNRRTVCRVQNATQTGSNSTGLVAVLGTDQSEGAFPYGGYSLCGRASAVTVAVSRVDLTHTGAIYVRGDGANAQLRVEWVAEYGEEQ